MKILFLTLFIITSSMFANIGKITAIKGEASVLRATKTLPLQIGFILKEKDTVNTGNNARVQIVFNDKTIISLGKNSHFDINEYLYDEQEPTKTKASFKMARGVFKSITGRIGKINPKKFKLKTKTATMGIRGTVFFGKIADGKPDNIACTSGAITVSTPQGMVEVLAGQQTTVAAGKLPQPPAAIPATLKAQFEKESGAADNEKESGQNDTTVGKQKANPLAQEKKENPPTKKAPTIKPLAKVATDARDTKNQQTEVESISPIPTPEPEPTPEPTPEPEPTPDPEPTPEPTPEPEPDTTPDTTTPVVKKSYYNVFHSATYTHNKSTISIPNVSEQQTITLSGAIGSSDSETLTFLGHTMTMDNSSGDYNDLSSIAYGISENSTTIIDTWNTANPTKRITSITHNEAIVTITFEDTAGDIEPLTNAENNGISFTDGTEITKGLASPYYYSYTPSVGDVSKPTFKVTDGVLSGTSKLYKWQHTGSTPIPIDEDEDGVQDTHTITLPTITLPEATTTYSVFSAVHTSDEMTIYSDDMQEFFIVKIPDVKETFYTYQENLIFGKKGNFNLLPTDGFSHYTKPDYATDSTLYATTKGSYINWKNKNALSYDFSPNGISLTVGNIKKEEILGEDEEGNEIIVREVAKVDTKTKNISEDFQNSTNTVADTSYIYLFGKKQQGLGGTIDIQDNVTGNSVPVTFGEFRDPSFLGESETMSTENITLKGFTSATNTEIDLDIKNDKIKGDIKDQADMHIKFGGKYEDLDSAYINNNIFAAVNFNNKFNNTSDILDGWLVATDIDTSTYYDDPNDKISWGFWSASYEDGSSTVGINEQTWIAAQNIVDDISSLSLTTASYNGVAMGYLTESGTQTFIDPIKSTIGLNFDFGANTLNTELKINMNNDVPELTMTNNFTNSDGDLDLNTNTGSIYEATNNGGSIKGSFNNAGNNTFGSFNFTDGANTAKGVYKAIKQ